MKMYKIVKSGDGYFGDIIDEYRAIITLTILGL